MFLIQAWNITENISEDMNRSCSGIYEIILNKPQEAQGFFTTRGYKVIDLFIC